MRSRMMCHLNFTHTSSINSSSIINAVFYIALLLLSTVTGLHSATSRLISTNRLFHNNKYGFGHFFLKLVLLSMWLCRSWSNGRNHVKVGVDMLFNKSSHYGFISPSRHWIRLSTTFTLKDRACVVAKIRLSGASNLHRRKENGVPYQLTGQSSFTLQFIRRSKSSSSLIVLYRNNSCFSMPGFEDVPGLQSTDLFPQIFTSQINQKQDHTRKKKSRPKFSITFCLFKCPLI